MTAHYVLTDYLEQALAGAEYDKLDDGTFAGRIPQCKGVVSFGATLMECERSLRSTLEDWVFVGLKLGTLASCSCRDRPEPDPLP